MATAKWATPGSQSADIAGTATNSLASGSVSAFFTYDNSSSLDLYGFVTLTVAAQGGNRSTGASVTLIAYPTAGSGPDVPTDTGSVGGGERYAATVTSGVSTACTVVFPMVRLYPCSMRFQVLNSTGQAFAASGNTVKVQPYNEDVS